MKTNSCLLGTLTACLLGLLWCGAIAATGRPVRPNILFIVADDLRPELGCYGEKHIVSPNIDRLASQGVLFERAYCQAPICMSSRASLLTSIHPTRTTITSTTAVLDQHLAGRLTLPEVFRQQGYYTVTSGKIMHEAKDAAVRSWDEPVWEPPVSDVTPLAEESRQFRTPKGRGPVFESVDVPDDACPDGQIAEKTAADLHRLARLGRPFLLACGFIKPHLPFYAPKKYWDLYRHETIALAPNPKPPVNAPTHLAGSREFAVYHPRGLQEGTDEWRRTLRHGYYACVSYLDACVGVVLRALEESGLAENTIVVFFGDQGWQLGEHDFWGKHNLMHRSLRVPLIVRLPRSFVGFKPGSRAGGIVELLDLFPTLTELAGLQVTGKMRAQVEGVSFAPLLREPGRAWKQGAFAWWNNAGATIVTADCTFTEWPSGQHMLYDLRSDPEENINVADAPEYRATRDRLHEALRAGWRAALPNP